MEWEKKTIDTGEEYWGFEGSPYRYAFKASAEQSKKTREAHTGTPIHVDTRKTIRAVLEEIKVHERPYTELAGDMDATGPWEEYALAADSGDDKWSDGESRVYVVFGGSEGIYLHIDTWTQDGWKNVAIMKTLIMGSRQWEACWRSAMRIAWYLSWHVN